MAKNKKKTGVLAFGKIPWSVRFPIRFAHFPYFSQVTSQEKVRRTSDLTILDIGCGPGYFAAFCDLPPGSRLFGLDLWRYQLKQAAARKAYDGLFQVNLVDGLPFNDQVFDVVICAEVIMYLPDARKMLMEINRVLKPDGISLIHNPIYWFPRIISRLRNLGKRLYTSKDAVDFSKRNDWGKMMRPSRINFYSANTWLQEVGAYFQILEVKGFRLFRNRISLMNRLENYEWYYRLITGLAERHPFLATERLIVARKR